MILDGWPGKGFRRHRGHNPMRSTLRAFLRRALAIWAALASVLLPTSWAHAGPTKKLFIAPGSFSLMQASDSAQIAPSFLRGTGNFVHCLSLPSGSQVEKLAARVYNGDPSSSTAVIHLSAVTSTGESPMATLAPPDQQLTVRGISTRAISDTALSALAIACVTVGLGGQNEFYGLTVFYTQP